MAEVDKKAGLDQVLVDARSWVKRIEDNAWSVCLVLALVVLIDQVLKALLRPFWFDELFTYYLARFDMSTMAGAVIRGDISNTLVGHGLVRISSSLFGLTEFGTRLPSIVAFLIAIVFLYRFVASRYGVLCGLSSALWLCLTGAYYYGSEARPYAIVLACASVAIWSWAEASGPRRRTIHVVVFGLVLALAIASHFYAILVLIPFGVGELARLWERRKIDWALAFALVLSAVSSVLHLPSMLAVTDLRGGFYSPVSWTSLLDFLLLAFPDAGLLFVFACAVSLFMGSREKRLLDPAPAKVLTYSLHEWAALIALALLPLTAAVLGLLYTNAFVPRYVLSSILGISALFPAILWTRLRGTLSWQPALVLLLAVGVVTLRVIPTMQGLLEYQSPEKILLNTLPAEVLGDGDDPVIVASPLFFPVFAQYAPAELKERLVYVADPKAAVLFTGIDTPDVSLLTLIPWTDLNIRTYDAFLSEHDKFLVIYASGDHFQWLVPKLQSDGRTVGLVSKKGAYLLSQCCK